MDRDFCLTEAGVDQAHVLGRHLADLDLKPEVIYHSRLQRAKQTAEIVAKYIQGRLFERHDIIEHGSEAYLTDYSYQEAAELFPDKLQPDGSVRVQNKNDKLSWHFSVGGEDLMTLHLRARNAWHDILAAHPDDGNQIVVVSHGSFLSAMMSEIFGCTLQGVWGFNFPNSGYVRLILTKSREKWRPSLAAQVPHVPSEVQQ
jgi:broad specificity phosphatase PhoE